MDNYKKQWILKQSLCIKWLKTRALLRWARLSQLYNFGVLWPQTIYLISWHHLWNKYIAGLFLKSISLTLYSLVAPSVMPRFCFSYFFHLLFTLPFSSCSSWPPGISLQTLRPLGEQDGLWWGDEGRIKIGRIWLCLSPNMWHHIKSFNLFEPLFTLLLKQ